MKNLRDTRTFYEYDLVTHVFTQHTGVIVDACVDRNGPNANLAITYYNGNSVKRDERCKVGNWCRLYVWHSPRKGWCVTERGTGETYGGRRSLEHAIADCPWLARDIWDDADTEYQRYLDAMYADMAALRAYNRKHGTKAKSMKASTLVKRGFLTEIHAYGEPWA